MPLKVPSGARRSGRLPGDRAAARKALPVRAVSDFRKSGVRVLADFRLRLEREGALNLSAIPAQGARIAAAQPSCFARASVPARLLRWGVGISAAVPRVAPPAARNLEYFPPRAVNFERPARRLQPPARRTWPQFSPQRPRRNRFRNARSGRFAPSRRLGISGIFSDGCHFCRAAAKIFCRSTVIVLRDVDSQRAPVSANPRARCASTVPSYDSAFRFCVGRPVSLRAASIAISIGLGAVTDFSQPFPPPLRP